MLGNAADPMRDCILLAACGANELLPQSPDLPADVFTSCLTTPIKVSSSFTGFIPLCWECSLSQVLQLYHHPYMLYGVRRWHCGGSVLVAFYGMRASPRTL